MDTTAYTKTVGSETISFKVPENLKLTQYGELQIHWQASNQKNDVADGFFYGGKVTEKGIEIYLFKPVAGKKGNVTVTVPSEFLTPLLQLKNGLLEERKEKIERYMMSLRVGTGKVRITEIGCDWRHLAIYPSQAIENEIGYSAAYDALEQALQIQNASTVNDDVAVGEYTVAELKTVAPRLFQTIQHNIQATQQAQKKAQEINEYVTKSGKTVVHVHHCLECGTWKILGGAQGRLEKSIWTQAVKEMSTVQQQKYDEQSENSKQILSAIDMGNDSNKFFALETEHFLFQVVSEDLDSHGC